VYLPGILAATASLILCTVLPFLPGGYDRLAVPLSAMAQMVGAAGLVIVPFGALWLAAERLPRLASWRFAFAGLTLIITAVVWALTSIVAAIQSGVAQGFAALVLAAWAARKIWPVLTGLRDASEERTHALPIYLVFVPIAVALLQLALASSAIRACSPASTSPTGRRIEVKISR
jgi:hypothetical protein